MKKQQKAQQTPEQIIQQNTLIVQSYAIVCLATELKNKKFIESNYFNDLLPDNSSVKQTIKEVDIDNQGFLLMVMYAMLVIPHELIAKAYEADYLVINKYLEKNTINTNTSYADEMSIDAIDTSKINFIRHLRNSIAHARVYFKPKTSVTFTDERINSKTKLKEHFSTDIPLSNFGDFLNQLQKIHLKYIKNNS